MYSEAGSAERKTTVQRILVGLVAWVCRRPRLVLTAAVALAAVAGCFFATHIEYFTQRSDLISSRKECQQRWFRFLNEFGDDDDMVVVVQGSDVALMRQALEAVAEGVRRQPDTFDRLFYKVDLRHLQDRALLLLSAPQIDQIVGNLNNMKELLETGPLGWQWFFTLNCLLNEARTRAEKLIPGQPLSQPDEQFLAQLVGICRSATATLANPADYHSPFESMIAAPPGQEKLLAEPQYFFSGDQTLAFLLVRPVKEAGSFTGAQRSVEALRAIVNDIRPAYPRLQFGLTGAPVLETDEMVASQSDTRTASWLAFLGVALLNWIVFRGFRYPLLIMTTILLGTAWATGWLTLTVGHLNLLSATFFMMLIGMGDYGVIWVTRYQQERRSGLDVETALRHTAARVGPGILTAAVTTALAFFAATFADFHAVAELGWIAGCGVLLCAFACFTVMPALLRLFDRRRAGGMSPLIVRLPNQEVHAPRSPAWPGWVVAFGVALFVLLGSFALGVRYDHNLLHLQAEGLDSVKWEQTLMEHTAGASWYALSVAESAREALALKTRFEQLPKVSRVVEMASLVPPDQDRKLPQLRRIQASLKDLPQRGAVLTPRLPSTPEMLRPEIEGLLSRLQVLVRPGAPAFFASLREQLAALYDRFTPVLGLAAGGLAQSAHNGLLADRLRGFDQRLAGDLAADLHRLRDVATPRPITLDDLPPALRERYVGRTGKWLVRVFARDSLWDHDPLQEFVAQVRSVDPEATGKPFGTLEGLDAMKHGFERAGLYAVLVIAVVLLFDFRRVGYALLALAPLGMGAVLSLGIMGMFDLPFNPANMIALPLVVGVGVNYGVYVLHDYRARRRQEDYTLARTTGRGILVAALASILGFGTLMLSSHRGLVGLGLLLSLGVSCSLLTALVFLPAALRLAQPRARTIPTITPAVLPRRVAA
jgi:hopanoid biosynthesis associated RND transporter like protein HpnN